MLILRKRLFSGFLKRIPPWSQELGRLAQIQATGNFTVTQNERAKESEVKAHRPQMNHANKKVLEGAIFDGDPTPFQHGNEQHSVACSEVHADGLQRTLGDTGPTLDFRLWRRS